MERNYINFIVDFDRYLLKDDIFESMSTHLYKEAIISETRKRIIEESIPRIKQCLAELTDEQIWYKSNSNTNAVGNQVLHLCGNVRQWILHGLDGQDDVRQRDLEFNERGPLSREILISHLDVLTTDLNAALDRIVDQDLLLVKTVQKYFHESGISILFHVTEHFSYHTGQITYFTKMTKDIDTAYYGKLDL